MLPPVPKRIFKRVALIAGTLMKKNALFSHSWGQTAGSPIRKGKITEKRLGILSTLKPPGGGGLSAPEGHEDTARPLQARGRCAPHSSVLRRQGQTRGLQSLTQPSPAPLGRVALSCLGAIEAAGNRKTSLMEGTGVPECCPEAPRPQRAAQGLCKPQDLRQALLSPSSLAAGVSGYQRDQCSRCSP